MDYETYFPKGLAKGPAFCNRVVEREQLRNNISTGQHTLLMSPRRFGKTSLVQYVINDLKILNGQADLFVAVDAKRIEQIILVAIKTIVRQVAGTIDNSVRSLTAAFKNINSQWIIGTKGINIVLTPDRDTDPAQNIQEALRALEELLKKKKQKAVLFIDEVQEIAEVAEGKGIEGAIRHVAQDTNYISFIFSGSKRHMLAKMFFDKSRPLYKLCDKLILDRIHAKDYIKHLNKLSHKRWNKQLSKESLDRIFEVTALHPYYINSLCLKLWASPKRKPTVKAINVAWLEIMHVERLEIAHEISSLSKGQRKILIAIAEGNNKALTSKYFLRKINMSASSVSEAIQTLEEKDYIVKSINKEYYFIDPLIKTALLFYYSVNFQL